MIRIDPLSGLRRGGRSAVVPSTPATTGPTQPVRPRTDLRARLRRLAVTAGYYLRGAALCRRVRPELVHANDYNTMWIALAAKLLCGSRVIYDSHELWPDRNGRPEWRAWLLACEWIFVRAADAGITTSPGYAEAIARRYRVPRPVLVRNVPDSPAPQVGDAGDLLEPAVAVYVGGLMPGRGLELGIEALALVPSLQMRLIGPGTDAYRAGLLNLAERLGVDDRLELSPPVAPGDVLAAVAPASFGLMLIEPVCRSYELTLPNKLFEYAAAGVPVLAGDLPVIGPMVRDHHLGEVVAPGDRDAVAAAMRRLIEPARNRELRMSAAAFARANPWSREREVLAAVYEDAVRPR